MSRRLMWILLVGLGVALLLLVVRRDQPMPGGLDSSDFASLVIRVAFIIMLSGALLALVRERLTEVLEASMFWVVIALILAVGYTYRAELREIADRVLAELIPGRPVIRGHTVEVALDRAGEFQIDDVYVNGAPTKMVLDTGASAVVLTQDAAKAAGLPLEVLSYSVSVDTAAGRTKAAAVTLNQIVLGPIFERDVPALVAQRGQLKTNLLGMSFLKRLESWEVRGDKLLMRGSP